MSETEFRPQSWRSAGAELSELSGSLQSSVSAALASTGDIATLGATGTNLVDSLLAGVIPAYQAAVQEWIGDLTAGISAEGELLTKVGDLYEATEDTNTDVSADIVSALSY